jgi:hypothetical protein
METLPDLSQFVISSWSPDISKLDRWPCGQIVAVPHTFPVTWKIENPATGFVEVTQEKMTPLISVQSAWKLLHNDVLKLFEKARFNYHGKLCPGQTIQADIVREQADVTVRLEICQKGSISFYYERIQNMVSWSDLHAHCSEIDKRIPPYTRTRCWNSG